MYILFCLLISPVFSASGWFSSSNIILSEKVPLWESWKKPPKVDERIVGGEEANIEDYPYQVSYSFNNSYFCGGFIVSENYILTAGHCSQNVNPATVILRAGSSYRQNGTIIPIAEIMAHPEYDDPAFDKDVGYMKTVEPIKFSNTIQPIPLAPRNSPLGDDIFVTGWGRLKQGQNPIPSRLMRVKVPVVNYWRCLFSYFTVLTDNMFCAGNFFLGGQGTCQGDSGGAAIEDGIAVGIVSFGRGCGQALSPSVFAKISSPSQGQNPIPSRLMRVKVPVVNYWRCLFSYFTVLTDNVFCAGNFFLGGQGTCQGDSGGAAIEDGIAVGIVSFGRGCGQALSPSVFAKISSPSVRDFISKYTGL